MLEPMPKPINELMKSWQLPKFTTNVLAPKSSRYAIIIPVINEGDRVRKQLTAMSDAGLTTAYDTVIADGGSTDGSLDEGWLKEINVRACLTKTGVGKLSAQLRMAYGWAMEQGYDGVITIDGNGKDSIENVHDFASALDRGVDYAQASRFVTGGESLNAPISRIVAIRLIHAPVLSLAAGKWLTDTTQGFRAYSSRYLLDPKVQPFRDIFQCYELLAYLTVRASQLGYNVEEIATTRSYPATGKTPTKIAGWRGQVDLLVTLFSTLLRRYHPSRGAQK